VIRKKIRSRYEIQMIQRGGGEGTSSKVFEGLILESKNSISPAGIKMKKF